MDFQVLQVNQEDESANDEVASTVSPHQITAGRILHYLMGIPLAILGMLYLPFSLPGGIAIILSGILLLPPFKIRLERIFNVRFSPAGLSLLVLVLALIGFGLIGAA